MDATPLRGHIVDRPQRPDNEVYSAHAARGAAWLPAKPERHGPGRPEIRTRGLCRGWHGRVDTLALQLTHTRPPGRSDRHSGPAQRGCSDGGGIALARG